MTEVEVDDVHAAADIPGSAGVPVSLPAATTALSTVVAAVRQACTPAGTEPAGSAPEPGEALDALLLLRDIRRRLAAWEPSLIELAREAGASWAEIAHPLGVTSRQAAERRYLRLRTGPLGTTGEQRVQATRDHRAANRTVAAWARDNAADLRRLAGRVTSLTDLPERARAAVDELDEALGADDPARLIGPLSDARPHLEDRSDLADRVDRLVQQIENLRRHSARQRRGASVPAERPGPGAIRRS
ncbi:type III effector protein [Streptomyces sp. NPDC015032]|uniref:type III effector protein n=1 Tax=Streptomyces sp. NPDC015032 TaxID=3364937 RepID=UPI0036FB6576